MVVGERRGFVIRERRFCLEIVEKGVEVHVLLLLSEIGAQA